MLPPDLKTASTLRSPPLVVPQHHPRALLRSPPYYGYDSVNEVSLRKIEEIPLEYTLLLTASPKLGCGVPAAVMLMAEIFIIHFISELSITFACKPK